MRRAGPFGWLMVEFYPSKWYFWVSNWQGLDSGWAIFIVNLIRFRITKYQVGEAHFLLVSMKMFTEKVNYIPTLNVDCTHYPMGFDLDRLKRKWEHGSIGKPRSASWSQWRKPLWSDRSPEPPFIKISEALDQSEHFPLSCFPQVFAALIEKWLMQASQKIHQDEK